MTWLKSPTVHENGNILSLCHWSIVVVVDVVVCRYLTGFTRCIGCEPTDESYPTNKLYLEYYYINNLTPLRLHTLCSISTQRTPLFSALPCLRNESFDNSPHRSRNALFSSNVAMILFCMYRMISIPSVIYWPLWPVFKMFTCELSSKVAIFSDPHL